MLFFTKLRNSKLPAARRNTRSSTIAPASFHLQLEVLEDRRMLSTLTVTNINDSGAGSLRAEIAAANSGDTIVFDSGLAGQTITLTGGELVINKSLTIEGTPGGSEAISGVTDEIWGNSYSSRILHIIGAANVTLDNLMIENGGVSQVPAFTTTVGR